MTGSGIFQPVSGLVRPDVDITNKNVPVFGKTGTMISFTGSKNTLLRRLIGTCRRSPDFDT